MDKQDINDAVDEWPFQLGLEEYQGNCKTCWKKSFKKLYRIARETPQQFDFFRRMEMQHGATGAGYTGIDRVFFRMATSTDKLLADAQIVTLPLFEESPDDNGGCSESCELYETGTDA